MKLIEERLPGRTQDEDRALRELVRKVESVEKKRELEVGTQMPQTDRGRVGRSERLVGQQQAVNDAIAALTAKVNELAETRLQLLPADATDIKLEHGSGDGDDRHPVVCTSAGQRVPLGGCATLGPAEDRARWFREAAERRRSQ